MIRRIEKAHCNDCDVPMENYKITHRKEINVAECKEKFYWKFEYVCPECGQFKTKEYIEKLND